VSKMPEALLMAGRLLEAERYTQGARVATQVAAAAELRRQHAEIERLRQENRLWYSRAVALFWKGDAGGITLERIQSAAKEIDAALQEVKP
jgi:pterin-4a-carbinolamine dehydratase